jgi:hypothetical protein
MIHDYEVFPPRQCPVCTAYYYSEFPHCLYCQIADEAGVGTEDRVRLVHELKMDRPRHSGTRVQT